MSGEDPNWINVPRQMWFSTLKKATQQGIGTAIDHGSTLFSPKGRQRFLEGTKNINLVEQKENLQLYSEKNWFRFPLALSSQICGKHDII